MNKTTIKRMRDEKGKEQNESTDFSVNVKVKETNIAEQETEFMTIYRRFFTF